MRSSGTTAVALAVVGALIMSGCGTSAIDDASAFDARAKDDAGNADALARDAGTPDVGPSDSGSTDAGNSDAGPADAELRDSSVADSGTRDAGFIDAGPVASNLAIVVNRDVDVAPTPINVAYVAAIAATQSGDRIVTYQKYFRNPPITNALMDAARRGVQVTGIYRDDVDPTCASLLMANDTIDCATMFVNATGAHHKNLMILRSDGTAHGIVGSYNVRGRSTSDPRVHTVVTFDVANGASLFEYYAAEIERLTGGATTQPLTMSVPVTGGGNLAFTFAPGPNNPVMDLLNGINTCTGTLWLSYFGAFPDSIGRPAFDRLETLFNAGCDVRVLLDQSNNLARLSLAGRGVPVQFPTFPNGAGTLGHKIVSVVSNGETHLLQGSANLDTVHFNVNHNLTVYIRVPTSTVSAVIDTELSRYWVVGP